MPMHGGVFRQLVSDKDANPVSFNRLNGWTCRLTVVAPEERRCSLGQFTFDRLRDKMKLFYITIHAIWQCPAVERDDRGVIRARCWPYWCLRCRAFHNRGLGQAHIRGLTPGAGCDERCTGAK